MRIALKLFMTLLVMLAMTLTASATVTDFISDVLLIGNSNHTSFDNQVSDSVAAGWTDINKDLNAGAGGNYIHLLYKTLSSDGSSGFPITGFYIRTGANPPDSLTYDERTYYLVPCAGSTSFVNGHGDLNAGCGSGSAYIFLYYTKDAFSNHESVTTITFNNTQDGGVGANGGDTGYDLNSGCGSGSAYIYMHVATQLPEGTTAPQRHLDACTGGENSIHVQGWTFDPDAPWASLDVHVYVYTDASCSSQSQYGQVHVLHANVPRPDVNNAYHIVGDHGFEATIPIADAGNYWVKVWAINYLGGSNPQIGATTAVTVTHTVTLTSQSGEVLLQDGDILTGTCGTETQVKIADGATVTLSGVNITAIPSNYSHKWAGISCLGDAIIVLEGGTTNAIKGGYFRPGIYVPQNKTLTLQGSGTLNTSGDKNAAGIGSGDESTCGDITISGGTITAIGGGGAAGIGSGYYKSFCGNITINGGTVTATGGEDGAGIGSGHYQSCCNDITISGGTVMATGGEDGAGIGSGWSRSCCGNITISDGTVTATGGKYATGIGSGHSYCSCGDITISGGIVMATGGQYASGIGSGYFYCSCGDITISGGTVTATSDNGGSGIGSGDNNCSCGDITISGGTVTATGGNYAAGIGSGDGFCSCGNITITNGVTRVTATKGYRCNNAIGSGESFSLCDTITIGGVETGYITQSPFVTFPYTVAFDANDGTGSMDDQEFMYNVAQNLNANSFTHTYYFFDGWATSANGEKEYDDEENVINLADTIATVTLYAKWKDNMIYIGSGDSTSAYLPLNNYYKYSLTEQIYTAAELGEAGVIERIGFFKNSNKSCVRDIVIYMVHTDKSEFDSISDWITVTEADRVFNGAVSFDDYSWTDITLDEVFVYDGLHNVVIVVDDNTGGYNSTTYFSTFPTEEVGQALYQYSDGTNFDPMETLVNSSDVLSQKNQLRILKNELCDCMKPSRLIATEVAPTFIVLDWTEYGTSENWLVRYNGAYVEASEHPFTLTGLAPDTEYTITVSPICDTSLWSRPITLTTLVPCPAPFNVEVDDITYNSVNVTWTGYSESYTVHYRTASVIADTLLNEGFEGGIMPDGWAVEGDTQDTTKTWRVGVGDSNASTGTHSGDYNALITHATDGNVTYLVTPAMNLSGLSNLNLYFWYINRIWSGDIDGFAVCYREGDNGDWSELWSTTEDHATWTFQTISLTGLPDNCQIGFRMTDSYGRGVGLDDILIGIEQIGEWETLTATATSKTLTGLIPETEYEVYINPYCDETAVSETASFTTPVQTVFTFTKDIEGYGDASNPGGWYLIASPVVEAIAPSADNGFLTNEYDLYFFDPSFAGAEWRNYKDDNFLLTNGKGFLYASEQNTTLIFTGTPYTGNGEIELAYTSNVPDLGGWNLVGNPYAETAYVDRDCYVLNDERSEIIAAEGSAVEAMEGIFVVADSSGETVTFSPTSKGTRHDERIVLNLTRDNGIVIDRAIVRFGKGKQLPKFQLDSNKTRLYISQEGKDYAIADATEMGEMPVNFKAEKNGTYTLTFSIENLGLDHLHLIDNLTDADVDLLETPKYTFEAKTTDRVSRFRLVF